MSIPIEPEPGPFSRRVWGHKVRDWILFALKMLVLPLLLAGLVRIALNGRAEAAAQQVVVDLQLARKRAIVEKAAFRVVFTPSGSTYVLQKRDAVGNYTALGGYALPWGATFGDTVGTVEFSPTGTLPSPTSIYIHYWSARRSVKIGVQGDMLLH